MTLPIDFFDVEQVIEMGAKKHGADTWKEYGNPSMKLKNNHASMSRHLSEYYCGVTEDAESGLHPLLHLACRALMAYTVQKKGVQEEDALYKTKG
jgi:hypothetical protein